MAEGLVTLEMIARGVAIGALLAMAAGFVFAGLRQPTRLAGLMFTLGVIAYVLNSSPVIHDALGSMRALDWTIHFFSLGGVGLFWLFIITLFEDRTISVPNLAPWFLLTFVGLLGVGVAQQNRPLVWIVHNLIETCLALHALFVVWRSWRGDLVETRRRIRGPFLAVVTLYVLTLSAFETAESLGFFYPWFRLLGAATLALYCLAGAAVFLQTRAELFGVVQQKTPPAANDRLDAADRLTLAQLTEKMDAGVWRREGLTIGDLAAELGVPEHRLRPLINDHLGFRNFAAFVNARRIDAAKRVLADPEHARTTIAVIAFDLGFGSLGPFNRAFKEATGVTPSEFRRSTTGNSDV
jgi:AraC-like DNA-binding protein